MTCLPEIEAWVKRVVQDVLAKKYGGQLEDQRTSCSICKRAKGIVDGKNYDSISSGDSSSVVSIWDRVTLKECKEIVTVGSHWTDLFENALTRPEEVKISGGNVAKTKWIEQTSALKNKLSKPFYSVSTGDLSRKSVIESAHDW